ncbi:MAG: hypothetical protein M3R46_05510 [Actinomycetota bacterium]|nr:hypothetical protein [Actinomycetota bacterium]MDQ3275361.1 hypothetical protein [Actinomycetota bacterium]
MEHTDIITARGSRLWGGLYAVELVTTTRTWTDSLGERSVFRDLDPPESRVGGCPAGAHRTAPAAADKLLDIAFLDPRAPRGRGAAQ